VTDCPRAEPGSGEEATEAPRPQVVDIFRAHAAAYRSRHRLSPEQARVLRDTAACRTAALSGHLYVCPKCAFEQPHYNSCRNRHCPNCQALEQARWIEAREKRVLPVGHHHVVVTLPAPFRPLARRFPSKVYEAFFAAVDDCFATLARDVLNARLGVTAVLHTWTRELNFHPHLHCVVTAGGLTLDGKRWVERTRYLFPVRRMKALFRARLLARLDALRGAGLLPLTDDEWTKLLRQLPTKSRWVVYIKQPFGRSTHVLRYLGRYTHRIAISDQRLVSVDPTAVTFRTRADHTLTLSPEQFIGRFLQHVLPHGLRKIRHFGLYAPGSNGHLACARRLLGEGDRVHTTEDATQDSYESALDLFARLSDEDPLLCPRCKSAIMEQRPLPRDPPTRPP